MSNKVKFNERTNSWGFYHKSKFIGYSVNKYGALAELLAEESYKTKQRYKNYIENYDTFCIMKIYSKQTGEIHDVLFDTEFLDRIQEYKWYINVPQNSKTYYVASDGIGKLHRFVMDVTDQSISVDHINRNGLDNRLENLRNLDTSQNKRNMSAREDNKIGINGISYSEEKGLPHYTVTWSEGKYNFKKKRFYLSHYDSREECLQSAIDFRKEKEELFYYNED